MTSTAPGGTTAGSGAADRGDDAGAPGDRWAAGLRAALAHHWHPVCAATDLPGPVAVRLLGRDLVVAQLDGDGADGPGRTGVV